MRARAFDIVVTLDGADVRRPVDNVVPFVRPDAVSGHAPPLGGVSLDARPVPVPAVQARWPLFFAASLALHAGVFAAFYREAPPLASVGEKAISVEIVLGTHAAAGLAKTPTQSEASVDSAPAQGEGPELVKPETARSEIKVADVATPVEAEAAPTALTPEQVAPAPVQQQTLVAEAKPVEHQPTQANSSVPEAKPVERQPTQANSSVAEAKPVEHQPTQTNPQVAEAETPVTTAAVPLLASTAPSVDVAAPVTPTETRAAETPPEVVRAVTPPPRKRRTATKPPKRRTVAKPPRKRRAVTRRSRNDKGRDSRTRQSRASAASTASSGIGRGRSDAVSNYRGIVAARLARNKHFPPAARRAGHEGRAVVSFTISGGGRVTRVALVRGTGIATLDREARAMVNRSSPFPPPPSQRSMRFTVPVSFNIR